jgi:hypothetical protein
MKATDNECGLTADRLREVLAYDPETGEFTWREPGFGRRLDLRAGCASKSRGYVVIRVDGRLFFAHRLAWLFMTGEWPADQVDHKNNRRADNRWMNLRPATVSQNNHNRSVLSRSTSGVKGVSRTRSRWRASVRVNGRTIVLGHHDTKEAAAAAYRAGCIKHFGDFARVE